MLLKKSAFLIVLLCLLLAGCEEPRVDTSSKEAYDLSMIDIRDHLPDHEIAQFESALKVIYLSQIPNNLVYTVDKEAAAKMAAAYLQATISGKTPSEIIALAKHLESQGQAREYLENQRQTKALLNKYRQEDAERERRESPFYGLGITRFDLAAFAFAIVFSFVVAYSKNPNEKGTNEYESLRLCRIGLALLVWSYGFGLIGLVLALVAFIMGILGIVKGRSGYGIALVVGSVAVPMASSFVTLSNFFMKYFR